MLADIFRDDCTTHYVRELDGGLFSLKDDAPDVLGSFSTSDTETWAEVQKKTMDWAIAESSEFERDKVVQIHNLFDDYFKKRGPLSGNVLDVGGGWGLYRQWWTAGDDEVFVVHDPGIERFRAGAHEAHKSVFAKGFERPLVFVEGFGESLPYRDEYFDTVLTASALDHCVDPSAVIAEMERVLKPGGTLLVLLHLEDYKATVAPEYQAFSARVRRVLEDPSRVLGFLKARFANDHHLHHYTTNSLVSALRNVGLMRISVEPLMHDFGLAATEGYKPYVGAGPPLSSEA